MTDSKVHCGLYDPDRSTDDLLFITTEAAREARLGPDVGASVVPVPFDGPGGLVDLQIEYSDLAPELRQPWTAMGSRLVDVITYVQPAIAVVDRDLEPGLLPALTWTDARTQLTVGWVREGALTARATGGLRGAAAAALGPPARGRAGLGQRRDVVADRRHPARRAARTSPPRSSRPGRVCRPAPGPPREDA